MSREQRVPYCEFATNLVVKGASPLLRRLYVQGIVGGVGYGNPEKDMLEGLKERPQDLRVVYNLIGSPGCATEFDPWFGLIASAMRRFGLRKGLIVTHDQDDEAVQDGCEIAVVSASRYLASM